MKRFLLLVMSILLAGTALAEECSNKDFAPFCETKAAVERVLSYPTYTGSDQKVLNRAGDMAALVVIRSVSMKDLNTPEKTRQILLVLNLAFAAPQLITPLSNRRPTAAMLLLDHLEKPFCGQEKCNEVENIRSEIQHNTTTGHPYEFVTLKGEPPFDAERTRWMDSVLRSAYTIKEGMTRGDLLKVYATEGGISTGTQRTYVLKGCRSIKVDVEFKPVGRPERDNDGRVTLVQDDRDVITKISRPYLGYGIAD
jgi:hypothetical protein